MPYYVAEIQRARGQTRMPHYCSTLAEAKSLLPGAWRRSDGHRFAYVNHVLTSLPVPRWEHYAPVPHGLRKGPPDGIITRHDSKPREWDLAPLALPGFIAHCLAHGGFTTPAAIAQASRSDLMRVYGIKKKNLAIVEERLATLGLKLKED